MSLGATLTASSPVAVWSTVGSTSGSIVELSTCSSTATGTNIGAFSELPVGAAYYGSTVGRGAVAFSNFTLAGGGGVAVSNCGTIRLPFGPGASYYIVVGTSVPPTGATTASVTVTSTCAASMSCPSPSSLLRVTGINSNFNGLYAVDSVTPLLNGKLTWVATGIGASDQRTRIFYAGGAWVSVQQPP